MSGRVTAARDTRDERIGWIVFDQPQRHNAISVEMWREIPRAAEALAADDAVRVVVLRGAGDKAFISGADIEQLESGDLGRPAPSANQMSDNAGTTRLLTLEKPVILELARPISGQRVLDLGCGDAEISLALLGLARSAATRTLESRTNPRMAGSMVPDRCGCFPSHLAQSPHQGPRWLRGLRAPQSLRRFYGLPAAMV